MGNHNHRRHSVGLNDVHETEIIGALQGTNGLDIDFAIRKVPGTREAVRRGAQAMVDRFLRSGGELPLPTLDTYQYSVGSVATTEMAQVHFD